MEKSHFKKYLHILDKIESHTFEPHEVYKSFLDQINENDLILSQEEFVFLYQHLSRSNNLIFFKDCFDLSQSLYIFARSAHHSKLEALAIFEAMIQNPDQRNYIKEHLRQPIRLKNFDEYFLPVILDTLLIAEKNNAHYLNLEWMDEYLWIIEDVERGLNCSDCLKTNYTHVLYAHTNLVFHNENLPIAAYSHLNDMMKIYPQKGVPADRNCSKDLQAFFKDCLFNEFEHSCCICKAALPQMLIASHIKPFRDCGYLIEAMDSNNGLLLCRNHDYLFDQGYISFDENGQMLIDPELSDQKEIYHLDDHFKLSKDHLNHSRKLFFEYHRDHIYRKSNK